MSIFKSLSQRILNPPKRPEFRSLSSRILEFSKQSFQQAVETTKAIPETISKVKEATGGKFLRESLQKQGLTEREAGKAKELTGGLFGTIAPLKGLQSLTQQAKKFKTSKEFVEKITKTTFENREIKNIPIKQIDFEFDIAKRDFTKAQREIAEGVARPISKEPLRAVFNISTGKYEIIDGYHRLASAMKQGKTEITAGIEFTSNLGDIKTKSQLTDIFNKARTRLTTKQIIKSQDDQLLDDIETIRPKMDLIRKRQLDFKGMEFLDKILKKLARRKNLTHDERLEAREIIKFNE